MNNYLTEMFGLNGKIAVVTGAAGGIGGEIASGLAAAGAIVVRTDVNTDTGAEYLDMCAAASFPDFAKRIAEQHGRIDILVNCAGINKREWMTDVTQGTYDNIMDVNLKGAFFLSQACAVYMKEGGAIINIGSHNTGQSLGGVSVYAAAKSALLALTRSQAVEWAALGIRANMVSPGHIKTELTAPTWAHPSRSAYLLERIAMGRPGTPQDVAGICVFLASDAAGYITGEEIRVDGGCVAGGQPWEM
jgi:NAD(P)-dependent dehydrogenase (short-subunit alcohol dehydrogenase family)